MERAPQAPATTVLTNQVKMNLNAYEKSSHYSLIHSCIYLFTDMNSSRLINSEK